ncbi:gamma-glutamylcyclotransferase (plasmid) [Ensifer adhaerens]|uniref:gamma-glutamylcyclotransferase n=1 Tax=Ensifer adhaerens TaxID=106592 RepID=UPI0023A9C235|nr:gamma-glutamylcyclotransferase [Ensifer adhaerens]WDZ81736.1 gamma-glutamylcyclotransferase [Ensifer adhaerens]
MQRHGATPPPPHRRDALIALLRREVSSPATTNKPRWVVANVEGVRTQALAFCADRARLAYTGYQPIETVADVLATAAGHLGSCAEYLYRTVEGLEQRGIRDHRLWRLQAMVAQRILASNQHKIGSV